MIGTRRIAIHEKQSSALKRNESGQILCTDVTFQLAICSPMTMWPVSSGEPSLDGKTVGWLTTDEVVRNSRNEKL
jgi:hypothetical protein